MIENEFKIMLTSGQYEEIHEMYSECWDRELEQVNYYYDTPELEMSDRHITVRVRKINDDYFLQVKLPAESAGNGAVSRVELEKRLTGLPKTISGADLTELSGFQAPEVFLLGELTTRRSVRLLDGAEIDLDKSTYFGRTDYELEVEYTDEAAAKDILDTIRSRVSFDMIAPTSGKIRRFLAEYILRCEER